MTSLGKLEEYLNNGKNGFLYNESNNGKTIMISGEWGSGKTFFWKNKIEKTLVEKLKEKNKTCVYVSLYGRESISEIKFEIFRKAYNSNISEDAISQTASFFGTLAPALGLKEFGEIFSSHNQVSKNNKAEKFIKDGSVICLDDFERKSKKIDLNDLFGLISHIAEEYNCKLIIILNSEVFKEEEAEIFLRVKEKTVNKFFKFTPTIKELFDVIFMQDKYIFLKKHEKTILESIKETKELNARIYSQVLDNCLEWIENKKNENALRALSLSTVNFIKNHFVFYYHIDSNTNIYKYIEDEFSDYSEINFYITRIFPNHKRDKNNAVIALKKLRSYINIDSAKKMPENYIKRLNDILEIYKYSIQDFYYYAYELDIERGLDKQSFDEVCNFVETGLL